ncbi:MAG: hypothetical protein ACRDU0_20130, partial [Mycobacterium sp.]
MNKLLLLGVAAAAAAALGAGCNALPYAAVVNGTPISQSALNQELTDLASDKPIVAAFQTGGKVFGQGSNTYTSNFVANVLSGKVNEEIFRQELARRGLTITPTDLQLARADVISDFNTSAAANGGNGGQSGA